MINLRDGHNNNWIFYNDDNKNLCFEKNGGESEILQENCSGEFDICFDDVGNIHAIFQLENGELGYIQYDFQNWKRFCVLKSKHGKKCFSNIRIFCINRRIEVFYCLFHNYKYYVVHHRIDVTSPTKPIALDYCCENKFSVCCDKEANVHIIYKSETDEIIHKTFNTSSQSFYERRLDLGENIKDVLCLYDSHNDLNLLYVSRTKTHYTLTFENTALEIKRTLGFGTDSVCIPYFYTDGNSVFAIWHERFFAYQISSSNFGQTFSKTHFLGRDLISEPLKICGKPLETQYITKRAIN